MSQLDLCCEKWGAGFVAFFKIAAVLISTQIRHLAVEELRKIPRCSKTAGLGIYTFALRMPLCTRDDLTHQFMLKKLFLEFAYKILCITSLLNNIYNSEKYRAMEGKILCRFQQYDYFVKSYREFD